MLEKPMSERFKSFVLRNKPGTYLYNMLSPDEKEEIDIAYAKLQSSNKSEDGKNG